MSRRSSQYDTLEGNSASVGKNSYNLDQPEQFQSEPGQQEALSHFLGRNIPFSVKSLNTLVEKSELPIFILYSASWCGPCQNIKPIFITLSQQYGDKAHFIIIDVDEFPGLAKKNGIQSMPTFLFLVKTKIVEKITGSSKDTLSKLISKYVK